MASEAKLSHNKFILSTIVFLAFMASFTTCYFATPTVFGGRDQGAIATAAIDLVKYKSFTFSAPVSEDLFQKYGPGKALNYPGFDYTKDGKLVTRFPKAYIVYLAAFYALLGLKGIQYANFFPLALFLILFWLTLRRFFPEKISFLGFLIAATFFPFLWFAKYALTEIFMLALVWTGIYFLIICRRPTSTDLDVRRLQISLAALALSALTRIEGIIFFLIAISYIHILNRKKIISLPKNFQKYLFFSVLFLLIVYILFNFPSLSDSLKNIAKTFLPNSSRDSAPSASLYSHLIRVFFSYNILVYFFLGLASIFWLLKSFKRNWMKPEFLPLFLTFPAFFYLISPQITLDDPWMLRRFIFAVFPALIFYSIYFINRFFRHKIFLYFALTALVAANSVISWRFLSFSENRDLLPQIEKISQKFGPADLILVDRLATGSGFSLLSEPMRTIFGKNAVYFFNSDDLNYIKSERYKNIYLIAPFSSKNTWYENIQKELVATTEIENNVLTASSSAFDLARDQKISTPIGIWRKK